MNTKKILKAIAAAVVLTGVMLGSSGCLSHPGSAPAALQNNPAARGAWGLSRVLS